MRDRGSNTSVEPTLRNDAIAAKTPAAGNMTACATARTMNRTNENTPLVQILVKLDNCKTYCLNFNTSLISNSQILTKLSHVTGIPNRILHLRNQHIPQQPTSTAKTSTQCLFLSAYTFLPLRGGKGGFGTLLKGQSKQAGAKRTIDFGACRDLNGRRLRHVNDEIKLRKWREAMQKRMERSMNNDNNEKNGLIDVEEEMENLRTASGIYNWHLMTPNWSEVGGGGMTNKGRKSMERQLRREVEKMARQSQERYNAKMKQKQDWNESIMSYAKAGMGGDDYEKEQNDKMTSSILQGFNKRKRRKLGENQSHGGKKQEKSTDDENNDQVESESPLLAASTICTLSGDVILQEGNGSEEVKKNNILIQSKSEFATTAILLNLPLFQKLSSKDNNNTGIYYEVTIQTCGVSQLGWAKLSVSKDGAILPSSGKDDFLPNSDTGDGVGDDAFSFGFDGYRSLSFHNGQENKYGTGEHWSNGDIIGCMYDYKSGLIQYSINGQDLGVAYTTTSENMKGDSKEESFEEKLLYPVFSLNENEIIGLNTGPTFQHCPKHYCGVGTYIVDHTDNTTDNSEKINKEAKEETKNCQINSIMEEKSSQPQSSNMARKGETKKLEDKSDMITTKIDGLENNKPVDLSKYDSPKELESLGPDTLKRELFRLGCKCGGSLQERAARLFSTKNLKKEQFPKKIRGKNFNV